MKKYVAGMALVLLACSLPASADVSITSKQKVRSANLAKKAAQKARKAGARARRGRTPLSMGGLELVDASGLHYFIDTNITTSSSSSASGALSEASYQAPVVASTSLGGTTTSTLDDMVDDPYNAACVNIGGTATMPCDAGGGGKQLRKPKVGRKPLGGPNTWNLYFGNGAPTLDPSCGGQQAVFEVQNIGGLQVSRKIYVPTTDTFARWLNIFTNPTGAPITLKFGTKNNLGSDDQTHIVTSSNGTPVVDTSTTWVTTFQNFSGNTSSDPRIGHVLRGPGGIAVGLTDISFQDGNEAPYWSYVMTIPPGGTQIIMNFVTGQGTKAAAAAKAAAIAASPDGACMTVLEKTEVMNFTGAGFGPAPPPDIPALTTRGIVALAVALAVAAAFVLRKSPF